MNLYVVQGVRRDGGGLDDLMWGALPFVAILIGFTILMIFAPSLATWLPQKMFGV
jgi:TRAP-type C4-dicarboxylate transport system permease large subunit